MTIGRAIAFIVAAGNASAQTSLQPSACVAIYPAPVVMLDTPSRYEADSLNRTDLDADAEALANSILAPVDDFIRAIVSDANSVLGENTSDEIRANCAMSALLNWARADALAELETETARLTVGSRLAGLAMAMRQLQPVLSNDPAWYEVTSWFERRLEEDTRFWASEFAPRRAASNNLRGWSALALVAGGDVLDRDDLVGYGAALTERLICSALEDGAYPLEMERGRFALHYHLHMLSALAPAAAIVETTDQIPPVSHTCRNALSKSVDYALSEIQNGGQETERRTGKAQSLFAEGAEIRPDQLAWLAAYLSTHEDPRAAEVMENLPWVANSKLGGNQRLIW